MDTITVIGMDPSMTHWGYCRAQLDIESLEVTVEKIWTVITEKGKTNKQVRVSSDDLDRARTLSEALEIACQDAQIAFVEMPHGSQSASAMKSYAMCLGVLSQCAIPVVQLKEQDLKLRTTGKKSATKRESITWAFEKHPDAGWDMRRGEPQANNEHVADAIAAIHAGLQDDQFHSALTILRYMQKQRA